MFRKFLLLLFLLGYLVSLNGQPVFPEEGPLYCDEVVPRIDILIDPDTLDWLYDDENIWSNREFHAIFVFDNGTIHDTIEPVGFRLRGNTSRHSKKKSFKVSFNTFVQGAKYYGVEKLNLNGEHNDPSIMRSKICWDILRKYEIPAPRSNHVRVYINHEYYGLYLNVEHIDENFVKSRFENNDGNLYKCLYPADLDYIGPDPDLYKLYHNDRRVYDLKTNKAEDDYSGLANFIDVLNNTPDDVLVCKLNVVFNVYDYIKMITFDILTGNWDGPIYNKNNFYLYHNPKTGKFEYIPYDLDNTFGIDWMGIDWAKRNIYQWKKNGEPRPIYSRLKNNPEFRKQFTYYFNKLVTELIDTAAFEQRVLELRSKLSPYVINDPYYPQDYGFSYSDFLNSVYQSWGSHVKYGIIPYFNTRVESVLQQLENTEMKPVIKYINHKRVSASAVSITAYAEAEYNPATVQVKYTLNDNQVNYLTMYDDGDHNDGKAGDLIYGGIVTGIPAYAELHYQIEVTDNQQLNRLLPCDAIVVPAFGSDTPVLYINEFMASNNHTMADEHGNFSDWIEVYNAEDQPVYLGDIFLTDNLSLPGKWKMPAVDIPAKGFILFWADGKPELGDHHTNFKLSKGGEEIGIYTPGGAAIDEIVFGPQTTDISYGRLPDGGIEYHFFAEPTPGYSNVPDAVAEHQQTLFTVYPNPATGNYVSFSETTGCRVFNGFGQLVFETSGASGFQTGRFSPGLYLIVTEDGRSCKLIIQ